MPEFEKELPLYQCHKKVWALQIGEINILPSGAGEITPKLSDYPIVLVTKKYMEQHNPKIHGYFVLYEDGYQSYSPPRAFEAGYTRI